MYDNQTSFLLLYLFNTTIGVFIKVLQLFYVRVRTKDELDAMEIEKQYWEY